MSGVSNILAACNRDSAGCAAVAEGQMPRPRRFAHEGQSPHLCGSANDPLSFRS